jgi:hypothetical protein
MKPTFQVARRQRKLCDKEKTPRPEPGYKDGMERSGKARFHPAYKIMRVIKVSSVVLAAATQLKGDQNIESRWSWLVPEPVIDTTIEASSTSAHEIKNKVIAPTQTSSATTRGPARGSPNQTICRNHDPRIRPPQGRRVHRSRRGKHEKEKEKRTKTQPDQHTIPDSTNIRGHSLALTHPWSRALRRHRWSTPFYHIVVVTVIVTVATPTPTALGCRWPWSRRCTSTSISCGARSGRLRYDRRPCWTCLSRCRRGCSDRHNRTLAYLRTLLLLLLLLLLLWRRSYRRRPRGNSRDRRRRSMSHTLRSHMCIPRAHRRRWMPGRRFVE